MKKISRRKFISTTAAVSGLMILKPQTAFGYQANSAVRHALLGCGGRGSGVAATFAQKTSARIVALADIFPNQLDAAKTRFNKLNATLGVPAIEDRHLFLGHNAYQQLAASPDVDLIHIATPPWFHVQHLDAAVTAGKHVYCEKPVGIDVKQAKAALAIGKRVKPTQSIDVGFEVRNAPPIAALIAKIQAGALGKIASATGTYYAPASKEKSAVGPTHDEWRLRNWLWDRALSGDILVEQNIHIIDLCNLVLGAHPLKATATGGRSILTHAGDCWDNYQVDFTYPNNVHLSFASTQFGNGGFGAGISFFGEHGAADMPYAGPVRITGDAKWTYGDNANASTNGTFAADGAFKDNLALADTEKTRSFIDSITSGKPHNQIADGVASALSCMLGRMAGLTARETTWEQLLAHGETYPLGMDVAQFG